MQKMIGLGALALMAPLLLSGSPVVGASAVPPAKTAVVEYGDGPVVQDSWDQPVRLTFEATAGDWVGVASATANSFCENVELTGPIGGVPKSLTGFHVVPQTGTYTFEYDQVCRYDPAATPERNPAAVQLLKARVVPVARDSGTVRLPADRGYVDIAEVVVRERDEPLVLEANGGADHRLRWHRVFEAADARGWTSDDSPVGQGSGWVGPDVVLQDGGDGPDLSSGFMEAGEPLYFYTVGVARRVRLVPLPIDRVKVDGLGSRIDLGETRRVRFHGEKGQWIRLAGGELPRTMVLGLGPTPSAAQVHPAVWTRGDTSDALWKLPAAGRYSLDVLHAESARQRASYPIRVRSVRKIRGELSIGHPLTVELEPRQWVLHRVDSSSEGPAGYLSSLQATRATSRGWLAVLLGGTRTSGDEGHDSGCVQDVGQRSVDVAHADWVLVVPGRRRGTLDLALDGPYADAARTLCPDRLPY